MYLLSFLIAKSNIHGTFRTNYIKCIFEKCFEFKSGYNRRIYCCGVFIFVFLFIKKTSLKILIKNQDNFVKYFVFPRFTYKFKKSHFRGSNWEVFLTN